MLPSRRRRCEKEANGGDTGCPADVGKRGFGFALHVHTRVRPSRDIRAWQIEWKKRGCSLGEKDAEGDGGSWRGGDKK